MIQLSCGREIVDEISHFPTAKEAWNHLRILYGKEIKASAHIEQGTYCYTHFSLLTFYILFLILMVCSCFSE